MGRTDWSRRRLPLARRLSRARRIGFTCGRIYLGVRAQRLLERVIAPPDMARRWSAFHRESAVSIHELAIELQGLVLKGCQFIGARPDVAPPEYVEILSALQDQVPPLSFERIRSVVEHELGAPLPALFESFSREPIASASLAQVHAATLEGGEPVAVKVQYPEIGSLVRSDLRNLRALFRAVGLVEADFDLLPLIEELGREIPRELDFVNEGQNAERIAAFFEQRDDIVVPRIHWAYTTRRVLVMEHIDGIKINDTQSLQAAGVEADAIMRTLIEAYCEQILGHGFFHADPHPGNLLVVPVQEPGGPVRARLAFVDFGSTKSLPADFRESALAFVAAMLRGKPEEMVPALVDLGFETREAPERTLSTIASVLLDTLAALSARDAFDPVLARRAGRELSALIRADPMLRVPHHIVLLARVYGLLSGVRKDLDARVDLLETMLPWVASVRAAASAAARSGPHGSAPA